ncbi:cold-regulated 413 plasma membrane protein 1 isoform X2 [Amborella trichopoda]|uniref:cold-regulated 413 plasma membrane protein 1 isoform X2 n=1 Tax=Amborella trichopoda TaxID=13333 RepID=UPI0005D3026F|nr:cold-regulated 413 plasma membrane protein 1 isoform X2 [Amborella trichopoda]|eukprot:XP_011627715.1 cold-regulated 413 plasma membrane protein 1 isoform X2 [Amborella trichopoda]
MDMHGLMLGHTEKGDTFYHWGASVAAVGEFGMWASFLAVLAHFFCSPYFRASRFPVFVVAPSLVAHLLRGSIGWVVFCLTMGTWVGLDFIHRSGGFTHCLQKNQSIFYIIICIPLVLFPGIAGIRLA